MSRFAPAAEALLWYETSGRTDGAAHRDPEDPGGTTKWGIAQASHRDVDVLELTKAQALEIYRKEYWERFWLASLRAQRPATMMLLAVTNMNPLDPVRALQRACRFAGLAGAKRPEEDGRMGPITLAAANALEPLLLSQALEAELVKEYALRIDEPREAWKRKWFGGWIARATLRGLPYEIWREAADVSVATVDDPPPVNGDRLVSIETEPGEPGSEEELVDHVT